MSSELLTKLKEAGIEARFPGLQDREAMKMAYSRALNEAKKTKVWLERLTEDDVDHVVDSVLSFQEAFGLIIDEQYLFAYRLNDLWFRPSERTLEEFTVLRLYAGGSRMSRVIKSMDVVAKHYDCVSINSGTALAADNERVAKYYKRSGFVQDAITLWKNVEK